MFSITDSSDGSSLNSARTRRKPAAAIAAPSVAPTAGEMRRAW